MQVFKILILWLAFFASCFLPASALTPTAPESSVWEIFNTGYDAPTTEANGLGHCTETSTSDYDTAPIHRAATEKIPTEANRALFGQNTEFKAADAAPVLRAGPLPPGEEPYQLTLFPDTPYSHKSGYHQVTRTFVHDTDDLVEVVTSNREKIDCTPTHPFWVNTKGWIAAKSLFPGQQLLKKDGTYTQVFNVIPKHAPNTHVYNFEVTGFHTYYVGTHGLLVHNSCTAGGQDFGAAAAEGATALRPVVIGENMAGRVTPFAEKMGAETYNPGAYKNFVDSMQQQQAWIKQMAAEGRPIIDIGPDLARPNFSPYYDLETTTLKDMNYPTFNALQAPSGVPVR